MKLIIDIDEKFFNHIIDDHVYYLKDREELCSLVEQGTLLNEWIPTNKSLPEECIAVLVNCPTNKNIFCAYLEKGKWFIFSPIGNEKLNELVDAWMPLPNRYKEE